MGFISVVPAIMAVVLAFITRNAIISLAVASFIGVLLLGDGLLGFPSLLTEALGNEDFAWVLLIEVFIGILIAFFQKSGATKSFTKVVEKKVYTRKRAQVTTWLLGIFVFFSDYFSPLFTGSVMRDVTDKAKVSREKLAYIIDTTSAALCTLIPFTAWTVFIASLMVGVGPIGSIAEATSYFVKSIPYNFYAVFAVLLVGLIAFGMMPDFGPMRKAEKRAREKGFVIAPGSTPLMSDDIIKIKPSEERKSSIWLNFLIPVFSIVVVAISTFIITGGAMILEAFMLAVVILGSIMWIQRIVNLKEMVNIATLGIKGVIPAILILGLAYTLNTVTQKMGMAEYIISVTEAWLTPMLLLVITFIISAVISFFTGTSWGTYAIMMPLALPIAFQFSNNTADIIVFATIAAVTGGGVMGDHSSPLSDTSILSSLGAASDHMDHVKTQLPYVLIVAFITLLIYLGIGIIA